MVRNHIFDFSKYRVYHMLQHLEALQFDTQHIYALRMILTLTF
jgi:hypothetical protein